MIIRHLFRSGNDCIVHIPDRISEGFDLTHIEWEIFPPSADDFKEWSEDVYPNKVMPQLEIVARRTRGPGSLVQVAPGVCVWRDAERVESDS